MIINLTYVEGTSEGVYSDLTKKINFLQWNHLEYTLLLTKRLGTYRRQKQYGLWNGL